MMMPPTCHCLRDEIDWQRRKSCEPLRSVCLAGFSSDLLILQANSAHPAHDGPQASFYETLKRGEAYTGYYSVPFQEIVAIYNGLRDGKSPGSH